ncbi:MAG: DUF4340 domain-containing protein [Planctomycetota bacterium]|nr:DUF4340 domain-containing protein [Planctomycetota bacterium]
MGAKPTIVVVVLAVIGSAAAMYVLRTERQFVPRLDQPALLITQQQLPIDEVTRITLRRADDPTMIFDRTGRSWTQTEPFPHPVDFFSIRQMLVLAAGLEVAQRIGPDKLRGGFSESALGLLPPKAQLTFDWPGGSLTLSFGRRGAAGRSYLRITGDQTVYIVKSDLHDRVVEMDPKEWRDRTIFTALAIDADQIIIDDGGARTVLVKDRKRWKMIEPVQTRLDDLARGDFFAALGRARSGGFILDQPDDLQAFGLAEPTGSLTITSTRLVEQDGEIVRVPQEQQLLVGARMGVGSEDRFGMIQGRPVVVRLSEPVLRALFRRPESLADPTGSSVLAPDVKSLVIRGPGGEFRLVRDLDRWSAPQYGVEVPRQLVQDLLEQLTALRAAEIEFRPHPHEMEVATVTLYGFDATPLDTVRIAREADSGRWSLENGDDVLRFYPKNLQIRITPSDFDLQATTP